jgi:hypothetical protein
VQAVIDNFNRMVNGNPEETVLDCSDPADACSREGMAAYSLNVNVYFCDVWFVGEGPGYLCVNNNLDRAYYRSFQTEDIFVFLGCLLSVTVLHTMWSSCRARTALKFGRSSPYRMTNGKKREKGETAGGMGKSRRIINASPST